MRLIDKAWSFGLPAEIKLSVVITNYNYAHYIERAVFSVASQLTAATELIVIDDGSSDGSVELLEKMAVQSSVHAGYIVQDNAGPAAARNAAGKLCQGEWVLYLDADDELLEGALSNITEFLRAHPETDLLLCGMKVKRENGKEVYRAPSFPVGSIERRLVSYLIDKKISISHGSSVFRRDCVLARPYPEHLRQGEDIAVFAFLLSQPCCRRLDVPVARIYKHSDSLRHDAELTIKNNNLIAEEVFSALPVAMGRYLETYRAKRALSAFRTCYKAGLKKEARYYYHAALSFDMRQALAFEYVSKYLRLLWSRS